MQRMSGFPRVLLAVSVVITGMASVPLTMADTYTWDGGGVGNEWFTDGNWDLPGTPDHDDDVIINSGTVEHNGTGVSWVDQSLLITTVDQASSWWTGGPPRGGKSVTVSNGDVNIESRLFVGYGSVDGSSWTQSGGSLTLALEFIIGGDDYDVAGDGGNGTVYMNGGSIEVTGGFIHFCGGTQLFEQNGGTVTATSIQHYPSWHKLVFGSYDMNGGTLTLTDTGNPIPEPTGEAGTAWRFNFAGGDVYLGGDQTAIADEFWFNVTGDPNLYRATYHDGLNVTHLYYGSTGMLLQLR